MKNSSIQWTDHTFNAWEGCTKVAPECKNCYAEVLVDKRFGRAKWGKGQPRRRTSETLWKQPLRWNEFSMVCGGCGESFNLGYEVGQGCPKLCGGVLHSARVFCLSLGDWLDEEVPIEWFADLLNRIYVCENLYWQLLTKRPQNWRGRIAEAITKCRANCEGMCRWLQDWLDGTPPHNIWIGVSAGADIEAALDIPAKIHFLSCEPMLKPIDMSNEAYRHFDWIIFGGESGKNARPCDVGWIRQGVKFCEASNIMAFVKQLGGRPFENYEGVDPTQSEEAQWHRNGWCKISFTDGRPPVWNKNYRLRDSHGGNIEEWPEALRVREFPNIA